MKYTKWLQNIKGYSKNTIEVYSRYAVELESLNLDYIKMMNKYGNKSNSTKRLVLSAIKNYFIFTKNPNAEDIVLPKRSKAVSDYITFEEYKGYLLKININSKMGFQKYLIIRLLFETGIRSNELLLIKKSNIHKNRIKINGKGNKERYVTISEWLQNDLERYCSNLESDLLFRFSYKNLYTKIKRLDLNRRITPHMFRHGFARYCYSQNVSIYDISICMGHSSIETTARYINKKSEDILIHKIF